MLFLSIGVLVVLAGGFGVWRLLQSVPVPPPVVIAQAEEPRIVAAVMTAAHVRQNVPAAKAIEDAMAEAVHECIRQGISMDDTETMRAAMLAARNRVLGR